MKKRILAALFAVAMLLSVFAVTAQANDYMPVVIDDADILSESEIEELDEALRDLADEYDIDFVAASVTQSLGMTLNDYADFLYFTGYGDDAVFFVYQDGFAGDREIVIVRYGAAIDEFSDSDCEKIINAVQDDFADGDFADGYNGFVKEAEKVLNPTVHWIWIPGCLLIGFAVAFVIMKIIASANKSVRNKVNASDYVRVNSLVLTNQAEVFLYKNVSATPKANSSTSSGNTSGGGRSTSSGKF